MLFAECPCCGELVELDSVEAGAKTFVRKSKVLDDLVQQTLLQFWFDLMCACDACGAQWSLLLKTAEKEEPLCPNVQE